MSDPICGVCGRRVLPKDVEKCKRCQIQMCKGCCRYDSDGSSICAPCLEERDNDPAAAMAVFDPEPESFEDALDGEGFDTSDDGGCLL